MTVYGVDICISVLYTVHITGYTDNRQEPVLCTNGEYSTENTVLPCWKKENKRNSFWKTLVFAFHAKKRTCPIRDSKQVPSRVEPKILEFKLKLNFVVRNARSFIYEKFYDHDWVPLTMELKIFSNTERSFYARWRIVCEQLLSAPSLGRMTCHWTSVWFDVETLETVSLGGFKNLSFFRIKTSTSWEAVRGASAQGLLINCFRKNLYS